MAHMSLGLHAATQAPRITSVRHAPAVTTARRRFVPPASSTFRIMYLRARALTSVDHARGIRSYARRAPSMHSPRHAPGPSPDSHRPSYRATGRRAGRTVPAVKHRNVELRSPRPPPQRVERAVPPSTTARPITERAAGGGGVRDPNGGRRTRACRAAKYPSSRCLARRTSDRRRRARPPRGIAPGSRAQQSRAPRAAHTCANWF